jgi:ATPase subunit of ABC transporter with duplicated ATPase domains
MISFARINKQYGRQVLFVDASFQLNTGEGRLVGPNGAGKTTLFRMIVGEESPTTASDRAAQGDDRLLPPGRRGDVGRSVLDEAIAGSGRVGDLHHELEALQHAMGDPERAGEMDKILERFGEVQEEYDHLGGYALESQARGVLHGLGFDDARIDGDVGELSGAGRCASPWRACSSAGPMSSDGRADQPPRHRVDHLARVVPEEPTTARC